MKLAISVIDAFASKPFVGNPAAVCVLEGAFLDDGLMQSIAAEMNHAETAFLVRRGDTNEFDLRWFTPSVEVDLCGHATLASAHALYELNIVPADSTIGFHTKSGLLSACRKGDKIELDFPVERVEEAASSLGLRCLPSLLFTGKNRMDWLVQLASADELLDFKPDFSEIESLGMRGLIVTAPGFGKYDFVSRFFAPQSGISEDPVTGSAHCALAPYWSDKLGRRPLLGFQASKRGGEVETEVSGDRVLLRGHAVTTLTGELTLPS